MNAYRQPRAFARCLARAMLALATCCTYGLGANAAVAASTPQAAAFALQLSSSKNPASIDDNIYIIAKLGGPASGGTGTIDFYLNGTIFCRGSTVARDTANCGYRDASPHTDTWTARYNGDGTHAAATAAAFTETVDKGTPAVNLQSNKPSVVVNNAITLTAKILINPISLTQTATGKVTFYVRSSSGSAFAAVCSGVTLVGNSAACGFTPKITGNISLFASYTGDANFNPASSGDFVQTSTLPPSTTTLSSSLNPSNAGQEVTFTAKINPGDGNYEVKMQFVDGLDTSSSQTVLGTGTVVNGVATFKTSALAAGSHSIHAVYPGSPQLAGSISNTLTQTVKTVTYLVTPSAGPNGSITPSTPQTINAGAATSFTVAPASGYEATVGGTCGGTLNGNTYTTAPVNANCSVVASFKARAATSVKLNQFGLTGAWYNPATSGQGLVLTVMPDLVAPGHGIVFAGWFTFDVAPSGGAEKQRWYVLQGDVDNTHTSVTMPIFSNGGGNFDMPPKTDPVHAGDATLTFSDCAHGTLDYHFIDGSGRNGSIPLTRLDANLTCAPGGDNGHSAPGYLLSGAWYEPAVSGQGLVLVANPEQHLLFAAWYTFAPNALANGVAGQRWYVFQSNNYVPGAAPIENMPVLTGLGGVFDDPHPRTTPQLGNATLTFTGCAAATLQFHFDSGSSAGLSDTIPLQRLGAMPANCGL